MKAGLCFALAGLRAVAGANTAVVPLQDSMPVMTTTTSEGGAEPIFIGGGIENNATIIGGRAAAPGVYPWHALPNVSQTGLLCGAFLIHADVLASAAHCAGYWAGFDIIIGSTLLYGEDAIDVVRGVQEYVHPDSNRQESPNFREDNDIMLIKLESPSRAPVAKLNTRRAIPQDGGLVTALGFGYYLPGQNLVSNNLLEADIRAVDDGDCVDQINSPPFFDAIMLCAGSAERGICRGDSGSPIIDKDSGEVVGISSFATSTICDRVAVFTRISAYDNWIKETICQISDEPPERCISPETCRERHPCNSFSSPGYLVHVDINILGLFPYCFEICAISAFAQILEIFGGTCGECS